MEKKQQQQLPVVCCFCGILDVFFVGLILIWRIWVWSIKQHVLVGFRGSICKWCVPSVWSWKSGRPTKCWTILRRKWPACLVWAKRAHPPWKLRRKTMKKKMEILLNLGGLAQTYGPSVFWVKNFVGTRTPQIFFCAVFRTALAKQQETCRRLFRIHCTCGPKRFFGEPFFVAGN